MVKYRPDPRGMSPEELYRWQTTLGPFRKIGFNYNYYRFYDLALKYPYHTMFLVVFFTGIPYMVYRYVDSYNGPSTLPTANRVAERPFEYSNWARDTRKIRGEWNNNFGCWSDSPDCGKDFKKIYNS